MQQTELSEFVELAAKAEQDLSREVSVAGAVAALAWAAVVVVAVVSARVTSLVVPLLWFGLSAAGAASVLLVRARAVRSAFRSALPAFEWLGRGDGHHLRGRTRPGYAHTVVVTCTEGPLQGQRVWIPVTETPWWDVGTAVPVEIAGSLHHRVVFAHSDGPPVIPGNRVAIHRL